jgi:hypothetical protein
MRPLRMKRVLAVAFLLTAAASLNAQTSDDITFSRTFLLRNVSGTASNVGPVPHHAVIFTRGAWTSYAEGAAFLTNVSQTGPAKQQTDTFSTNWFAAGAQRTLGSRGLALFRVRGSLEPITIKETGYPQLLQTGGDVPDRMRAQNLLGEAAADFALRLGRASFAHVYLAPVGDPALGAVPFEQRASSEEFAEAPFSYGIQETLHEATRVVTAGFATRFASLDGSVFHAAHSTGRHASIDDGSIDSSSLRLTITPTNNVALQASRGKLGDADVPVTSLSVTYGTETVASSAIWTRRGRGIIADAFAFEITLHAARHNVLARAENVTEAFSQKRTHATIGYIFDIIRKPSGRAGLGINIDYHSNTKALTQYGHKPQSIYVYVRARTESSRR